MKRTLQRGMRGATVTVGLAVTAFAVGAAGVHADETVGTTTQTTVDPAEASDDTTTTVAATTTTTQPDTTAGSEDGTAGSDDTAVESEDDTTVADGDECELLAADVERHTATFTVGPEGCEGEVGPISFSAFFLPGGMREPYEDQVLIAHHESNGTFYGEGSYELTLDIGTPCNWQTDLYFGVNERPKFRFLIADDFDEREVCAEETTTTTTIVDQSPAGAITTTTAVDDTGGQTTTSTTTTTTTVVGESGGETTTTLAASAGPLPGQDTGGTLPLTGSSNTIVLALIAGALVCAGVLTRRLARH